MTSSLKRKRCAWSSDEDGELYTRETSDAHSAQQPTKKKTKRDRSQNTSDDQSRARTAAVGQATSAADTDTAQSGATPNHHDQLTTTSPSTMTQTGDDEVTEELKRLRRQKRRVKARKVKALKAGNHAKVEELEQQQAELRVACSGKEEQLLMRTKSATANALSGVTINIALAVPAHSQLGEDRQIAETEKADERLHPPSQEWLSEYDKLVSQHDEIELMEERVKLRERLAVLAKKYDAVERQWHSNLDDEFKKRLKRKLAQIRAERDNIVLQLQNSYAPPTVPAEDED